METNNETVEQAYEDIRKNIKQYKTDSAYEHIACMYTVFAVEDMIGRILAAHKCEIAAKDDERLTVVATYETVIAGKDAEIARLRALVGELANVVSEESVSYKLISKCPQKVWGNCDDCKVRCVAHRYRALVAKAREVVK